MKRSADAIDAGPVFGSPFGFGTSPFQMGVGFPPQIPADMVTNENPDTTTSQKITHRLDINALRDGTQMHYEPGMPLLLYRAEQDINRNSYTVFTLQNINFYLEMAYLYMTERDKIPGRGHFAASPREGTLSWYSGYPTTVDEFCETVKPLGILESSDGAEGIRKRRVGTLVSGESNEVPNLWGNVTTGDMIGLKVAVVENTLEALYNPNGQGVAEPTPGKFLQVIPHVEKGLLKPIQCTNYKEPAPNDLDFYQSTAISQVKYNTDANGRVDWSAGKASDEYTPLEIDIYTQGAFIKIGRVKRVKGDIPGSGDINRAIRMYASWNELNRRSTLDIEVSPNQLLWQL